VLLVKDFGAAGPLRRDDSFMSNADVPEIATSGGLLNSPINPYSGKTFASTVDKKDVHISANHGYNIQDHDKNAFRIAPAEWLTVHDSIFNESNWHWESENK
jgi:hypothetical protein